MLETELLNLLANTFSVSYKLGNASVKILVVTASWAMCQPAGLEQPLSRKETASKKLLQMNRADAGDWKSRILKYMLFREVVHFGVSPLAALEFHLTYSLALIKAQMLVTIISSSIFIEFKAHIFQSMNKSPD